MKFTLALPCFLLLAACDGGRERSGNDNTPRCRTCASVGANCGTIDDNCGGQLSCGQCTAPENCGGSGTANVCGEGTCTPATCVSLGAQCGSISDGCSDMLNCGGCTAPETCGGGGRPNQCGQMCQPKSCNELGAQCGTIDNGCGVEIDCGNNCQTPDTCGGGGVPNQCGQGCVAKSCVELGAQCGTIDNGCGNTIDCGPCTAPLVCGAVTANICGTICQPQDCTQLGAQCGTLDNGCGTPIDCGPCTAPLTCGAVMPNQCGATCDTCPGGYSCDNIGVCTGGDPTTFTLDVITHRVAGMVTMNGQQPDSTCGSSDRAYVDFHESTLGYHHTVAVPCNGATTPFAFDGYVYPGIYQVYVRGGYSNMPSEASLVIPSLTINSDQTNLQLNVVTHRVAGVVTMNGQQPDSTCGSSDRAYVDFNEQTLGYQHTIAVPCDGATTPFAFDGYVYPGTFQVTVRGGYSNMPSVAYVVIPSLTVNSPQTNMTLNIVTHQVTGVVTMNGQQPSSTCGSSDRAFVDFIEQTLGYQHTVAVPCNGASSPFNFDGYVYPGTYEVKVRGGYSNMPSVPYVVHPDLAINSPQTNMTLNIVTHQVAGVVTMNGQQPSSTCGSSGRAFVDFIEQTLGYHHTVAVPCNGATTPFNFDGYVYPGIYQVKVRGGYSNMPSVAYVVVQSLVINSPQTSLTLNIITHQVAGVVTMNGLQPSSTCGSSDRAYVDFNENTLGYQHTIAVPCNGATSPFTFDGYIYPGTYQVKVRGGYSNMPSVSYLVIPSLPVTGPQTNMTLNILTHRVAGVVTMNGRQPSSTCGSSDRAYIDFSEHNLSYVHTIAVPCNGATTPFAFDGYVYPGTYEIQVRGGYSNMPNEGFIIYERVQIP